MAYDKYGNYYRYARENGRVRRIYLGKGAAAEAAAASDRAERAARKAKRLAAREEKKAIRATQREVADFSRGVQSVVAAALVVAGYYQSLGGEWKRRGRRT